MSGYRSKQEGMTLIGWIIVLGLIAFFTMLILKVGPMYLENFRIKAALHSLESEARLGSMTRQEIRFLLEKRMDVNEVRELTREDIKIVKSAGQTQVVIDYERRENIAANLDVIASFREEFKTYGN